MKRGVRLFERNIVYYRVQWMIIFTGFFEPIFYLLSIGFGVGALVGDVTVGGRLVDYTAYVAPGLLATSVMNGAVYESTMNVFAKLKHAKVYDAALAAPLEPVDIATGEIAWSLFRGLLYSIGFLVVMVGFGLVDSWWAVLVPVAATVIGFGFAAVGMAVTCFLRSWADFSWIQAALPVLFLFSATFFPLSTYPRSLQLVVQAFPLVHGVDMLRMLTTGDLDIGIFGHAAYFLAMGVAGMAVVTSRLRTLLLT